MSAVISIFLSLKKQFLCLSERYLWKYSILSKNVNPVTSLSLNAFRILCWKPHNKPSRWANALTILGLAKRKLNKSCRSNKWACQHTCWRELSVFLTTSLPPVKQQGLWLSIWLKAATAVQDRIMTTGIEWRPDPFFSREHLDCESNGSAPSKLRRQLNPLTESRRHASPRLSRCLSGTAKNFSLVKRELS